ncbi:MAG: radical SAM protein [Sphingobacteriales bacterium]|nr:MAG: radical SAM protein [Sphingobacteriales bacterium]TAF80654.1 MAG: radical SAM protein [Sphingobacteriales bacterium]
MISLANPHQRKFKNLRVSLTDVCNLNCVYCTLGNDDEINADHRPQQPASFFIKLVAKLHKQLHLDSIRLTGGEPLLYRHLSDLIEGLKQLNINDINLTSNGFLLARHALMLKKAGLKAINISLDAIDEELFFKITKRKNVTRVVAGIDTALQNGLTVKLNTVIMKGINENQILPLLDFAFSRNIPIRFLEVMAMGHLYQNVNQHFVSQQQILDTIATKHTFSTMVRKTSATAQYWLTNKGQTFGIIANETAPFCHDCNRLRLDAKGNIYGCLSNNNPIAIGIEMQPNILAQKLHEAMQQKQAYKFAGSQLSMLEIGG